MSLPPTQKICGPSTTRSSCTCHDGAAGPVRLSGTPPDKIQNTHCPDQRLSAGTDRWRTKNRIRVKAGQGGGRPRRGVRHRASCVQLAQRGRRRSGIPYYESKARIEEHIRALGLPATILRPVSFMDNFVTYNRPVLDDGELVVSLAVRPQLPMQLISVADIGAFAAIAFDRPDQFAGRTVEIAGDILTPPQIAQTFGRVCGLPARFRQTPIEQVRAFDAQLAQMFTFFNEHPSELADLSALRAEHPGLMRLETWLRQTGWTPRT